ncbi:hypothetical protein [Bradyrhizobium sp. USDA 4353]
MLHATERQFADAQAIEAKSIKREAMEALFVAQIAEALYPILITDESGPADQAEKRARVEQAARAAWERFSAV